MNAAVGSWARVPDERRVTVPVGSAQHLQSTLKRRVSCDGVGLHGGSAVRLSLVPARVGTGIVFQRTDVRVAIAARFDRVVDTRLCTVLACEKDASVRVGTTEHLMAALAASSLDNVVVEIDGPELPIMDGSAAPFLALIERAGVVRQSAPRRAIEVCRTVRVEDGEGFVELSPGQGFSLDVSIDFEAAAVGRQSLSLRQLDRARFGAELADCRTFTFAGEIDRLRAAGLARGGSLENAVVVDGGSVLNPGGLRRSDEFVRHKMLDVIGDLGLAGRPIVGRFVGHRCGHALNNRLLRALFADATNWRLVDAKPAMRTLASRAA